MRHCIALPIPFLPCVGGGVGVSSDHHQYAALVTNVEKCVANSGTPRFESFHPWRWEPWLLRRDRGPASAGFVLLSLRWFGTHTVFVLIIYLYIYVVFWIQLTTCFVMSVCCVLRSRLWVSSTAWHCLPLRSVEPPQARLRNRLPTTPPPSEHFLLVFLGLLLL